MTFSQEPIVTECCDTLEHMVTYTEKEAFSDRLNSALDRIDAPEKGKGRQVWLAKQVGVSQKGARKWLESESIPGMENLIKIAKIVNQPAEWLLTGRGDLRYPIDTADAIPQLNDGNEVYKPVSSERQRLIDELNKHSTADLVTALEYLGFIHRK